MGTVLGRELELALVTLGQRLRANGTAATQRGTAITQSEPVISLGRIPFEVPDRSGLLEIAARSIGGLCGRVLTHSLGMSLEELILRPLVGKPVAEPLALGGEGGAAGVMMIPILQRGIYHGLRGLAAAQSVPGVTGVTITAEPGQIVAPPPDGASYLRFIFARASIPADAETALRIAHRSLNFDICPEYPAVEAPEAEAP